MAMWLLFKSVSTLADQMKTLGIFGKNSWDEMHIDVLKSWVVSLSTSVDLWDTFMYFFECVGLHLVLGLMTPK